jgi:hypothetical protein
VLPTRFVISGHVEATTSTGEIQLWWLEVTRDSSKWVINRGMSVDNVPSGQFDAVSVSDSSSLAAALPTLVQELLAFEPDVARAVTR